jgi:uncharacterized protein
VIARAVLAGLALAGPASAACSPEALDFRWPGGGAHFSVEIADDGAERSRGLMFRENLADSAGMLFVYDRPQSVAFWMKNTLIPLDMLFIGPDGGVRRIRRMARPHDTTPIPGGSDIRFVLEIPGGLAARLGLPEGAEMRHPVVDQTAALWPCDAP